MMSPLTVELRHAAVPGRVRLRLPALREADTAALEGRLRATPGILAASANALTGSVLLHHAAALSTADLMHLMTRLHGPAPAGAAADTGVMPWYALPAGPLLDSLDVSAQLVAGRGGIGSPVAFHAITLAQLLHALACRSDSRGMTETVRHGAPNNLLLGAVGGGLVLQVAAQALPPMRRLLGLGVLTPVGMLAAMAVGIGSLVVNEAMSAAARGAVGKVADGA